MNICAHPSGTSTSAVLAFTQKSLLFRKDHSSEMRNNEQFGSTITIHVPSPTSFSRQDVASSGTQSMSGREPIKAESSPLKADVNLSCRRMPPSYSQLRIIHEGDRTTSRVMLGQSPLFVGGSPEQTVVFANRCRVASCGPTTSTTASSTSPKSSDSGSNSSVDSGQGSGDLSSRSHSSKDFSESGGSYTQYARNNLPSYVRVASIMDHVLRTSSAMNSLLGSTNDASTSKELITKANMFIQIIEISPCARFLPDITVIKELLSDLQSQPNCTNRPIVTSSYFAFMLRKLMEEVLMIFARIISRYLSDCINKDRLLVIALEHLIHLMLFGDDICLEIIHSGGLNAISSFIRMPTTPNDTLRLLLRTLAILCRLPKGALKLLSLGRLDIIIQILCTRSVGCAVEAAGVLAQLTNPTHALIKLNDSSTYIIARLLDVVDECSTAESLLLCAAAIANVSAQHRALVDNLYQHNATARLIAALKRPGCDTVFVHEQLAVVFSRLANEGYEEALIAQGALPILLSMLTLSDLTHVEYCHRIRYKAALCLATIASKGFGLKAIYQNNGYTMVSKAIKKEQVSTTPTAMICNGIKEKLERKYQLESAV
uniref:Insc_C domain-containing protein n=1 Tax=Ascaris lumbricoides TaxID=6252 RepID=A0A0M3HRE8_ASCLU